MTEIVKTDNSLVPAQMAEKMIKLEQLKKNVQAQLDELKDQLLEFTRSNDVYTLKTGTYTISRCKRQTVNILDHEAAFKELQEILPNPQMVQVLSSTDQEYVKSLVKKGRAFPGTTHQETEYITVRLAKE